MRCAEVQELLAQGHSLLYFNAPVVHRTSPYVDEVDHHAYYCPECGEQLIHLLRARLRRRPGPIHLLRVNRFSRRLRNSIHAAQSSGRYAEEAPVVRVVNTIIQQAIKENAAEIEIVLDPSPARSGTAARPTLPAPRKPEPGCGDLRELMMWDIANIHGEPLPNTRIRVSYLVRDEWHEVMTMPSYIAPALWARFKSMADLLLTVQEEPQHGRIPIRYENRDYDLLLDTAPGEIGETLHMAIVPTRHPDRD